MSGFIESYRGQVLSSECDIFGHMNIQFYNACISQAMATMFSAVGLSTTEVSSHKRGFAAVEQNSHYYSEILAGDALQIESGVLGTTTKTITIFHRLFKNDEKTPAFDSTLTAAYMDLEKRKATPLDELILPNIETLRVKRESTK